MYYRLSLLSSVSLLIIAMSLAGIPDEETHDDDGHAPCDEAHQQSGHIDFLPLRLGCKDQQQQQKKEHNSVTMYNV